MARSAQSDGLVDYLVRLSNESSADSLEPAAWHLSAPINASDLQYETDPVLCRRAAVAHALAIGADTSTPRPIHLLRLERDLWVAFNGSKAGEFEYYILLGRDFRFLDRLAG